VKWLQRFRREGARTPVGTGGHRPSALKPHKAFLLGVRAQTPDITLEALSARLLAERGVKADTSMLSRFFRRERITLKKRRLLRASATAPTSAATGRAGANINARSILPASFSSTKPGPKPT
jgi:transposase